MAIDPSQIKRYAHGSRVPGWDDSVDLTKDPSVVPDPATTYVPAHVREAIETLMAKYPDIRSAAIPAMKIVQREHGWLSPTAMEQAACVLRLTPAYLVSVASFYDMFELAPKGDKVLLTLTHRKLPTEAERTGTAGGWHCHLTILVEKLEGRTPPAFWDIFRKIDAEYANGIPRA